MDLEEFTCLKRQAVQLKRDLDRAEGERDVLIQQIAKKYGTSTVEESKVFLEEMRQATAKLAGDYQKKLEEFKEQWSDKLHAIR